MLFFLLFCRLFCHLSPFHGHLVRSLPVWRLPGPAGCPSAANILLYFRCRTLCINNTHSPMFTLFLFMLLLSSIGHSFALNVTAHLGARSRNATTTLIQQKRQNGAIVTRLSTIFLSGDSSRSRTANPGYDCRIDLSAKLWGFCPTTVIAASDCGLAGSCVDNYACSKGCGFTDQDLTTFTWYVQP